MRTVDVYPSPELLAQSAAAHIAERARQAIAERGRFTLALSGGNTPHATFRCLASPSACDIDWSRVGLYWSDERCVPPGHPDSNYGAAKRLLLDAIAIPTGNVHRMDVDGNPADAALRYEAVLRSSLGAQGAVPPSLDLVLLGLGTDGHTASLFPEVIASTVLEPANRERWVLPVHIESRKSWRLTMTPTLINAAAEIVFLVFGDDKAPVVRAILSGTHLHDRLPAQLIKPAMGALSFYLDAAAARDYA